MLAYATQPFHLGFRVSTFSTLAIPSADHDFHNRVNKYTQEELIQFFKGLLEGDGTISVSQDPRNLNWGRYITIGIELKFDLYNSQMLHHFQAK